MSKREPVGTAIKDAADGKVVVELTMADRGVGALGAADLSYGLFETDELILKGELVYYDSDGKLTKLQVDNVKIELGKAKPNKRSRGRLARKQAAEDLARLGDELDRMELPR
jgi:hypothetical protein